MKPKDIILGVAGRSGGVFPWETVETLAEEDRRAVFEQDDYTCRCCGFRSLRYQEIYAPKGRASTAQECSTLCIYCHQCFHLDRVSAMRSGVLVWLPEISQADLHHVARAIYIARITQGTMAESARKLLTAIMDRREEVERRLGTDDPQVLATVLRDYLSKNQYEERVRKLDGVRLFPIDRRIIREDDLEFNQFPQILAYWRSKDGPFSGKIPSEWLGFYQGVIANASEEAKSSESA